MRKQSISAQWYAWYNLIVFQIFICIAFSLSPFAIYQCLILYSICHHQLIACLAPQNSIGILSLTVRQKFRPRLGKHFRPCRFKSQLSSLDFVLTSLEFIYKLLQWCHPFRGPWNQRNHSWKKLQPPLFSCPNILSSKKEILLRDMDWQSQSENYMQGRY